MKCCSPFSCGLFTYHFTVILNYLISPFGARQAFTSHVRPITIATMDSAHVLTVNMPPMLELCYTICITSTNLLLCLWKYTIKMQVFDWTVKAKPIYNIYFLMKRTGGIYMYKVIYKQCPVNAMLCYLCSRNNMDGCMFFKMANFLTLNKFA